MGQRRATTPRREELSACTFLPRLVVNGVAAVIHVEDLRFSRAEVERFFAGAPELVVSRDEVETIYRRSDGWPAAIQLFRLGLSSPSVRRSLSSLSQSRPVQLSEYLSENVLKLQSPLIQDFLLRTSVLTRLSASLCDEVTGRDDSHAVLLQLERSGLFVRRLDQESTAFEYHALFSSFLAEQLRGRAPALLIEVHARAARWHLAHGDPGEVVRHALASGDVTLAADTFNAWASELIAHGRIITVERWADRLPFAEIAARRDLAIKVGYALAFLRRRTKLEPLLAGLAEAQEASSRSPAATCGRRSGASPRRSKSSASTSTTRSRSRR